MNLTQQVSEAASAATGGNIFVTLFTWGVSFLLFVLMVIVAIATVAFAISWYLKRGKAVASVASSVVDLAGGAITGILSSVEVAPQKSPSEEAVAYKLSMLDATDTLPGDVARKVIRESSTDVDALRATVQLQANALAEKGVRVAQ
ncbi:hypothetical protein SH668x_001248 [Planctomicrobium sp. SH668]|uniref:hypothetical protein n=1 Tax=Planctomicrobium sp. SH668 TaxID=3448126 RepID=UPI003F5B7124